MNGSHRLIYLNVWSPAGRLFWRGLRGVLLDRCVNGMGFEAAKAHARFSATLRPVGQDAKIPATLPLRLSASCHHDHRELPKTVKSPDKCFLS